MQSNACKKVSNFLILICILILILGMLTCSLHSFAQVRQGYAHWFASTCQAPPAAAPAMATALYTAPPLPASYPSSPVLEQPTAAPGEAAVRSLQVRVQLSNIGTTPCRNIRMEIPLLAEIDSPYQSLLAQRFSHAPAQLIEREMGGRTMTLEMASLAPGTTQTITLDYTLAMHHPDAGESIAPHSLSQYLAPSPKIESSHPEIVAAAARAVLNSEDEYAKARHIYSYVISHMSYSADTPNRNRGALHALQSSKGVCEDYASLFVALCRAAGLPARIIFGYTDPQGTGELWNLPPGQALPLGAYRHAWAEFYVEGRGWLPADPTFEPAPNSFKYFAYLPYRAYIIQHYLEQNLMARFQGGQLAVTWSEQLVN